MELLHIEEHKIALFNIPPPVPVSFAPMQKIIIAFANDTDSMIAEDKQNSRITKYFHTYSFGRKQKQYLRWVANVLKMIRVYRKGR